MLAHEAKNYSFHLNSNIMSNMYTLTELCQCTHGVSEKFKYFVTFLRQNCITNQCDAANTLHKIYDENFIIECELIAYAIDNIIRCVI